jgi:membrane protease YdiL (CAAX protease family)
MTTTMTRSVDHVPGSPAVTVTQYRRTTIYAIWAAAALPMAALSWIVAPAIADGTGIESLVRPLLACMSVGLVWQFVLAMILVGHEQRSLRWSRLREALWLRSPRSPKTGRVGGRTWLVLVPLILGFGLAHAVGVVPSPADRDFGAFLSSDAGKAFFDGAWGVFALWAVMAVFNTVLGEELLFRGVLLPRMHSAFGDRDWIANGVLFGVYHLHAPWGIPGALLDTFTIVWGTKRYRSTWIGIAVHSAQNVFLAILLLGLVA